MQIQKIKSICVEVNSLLDKITFSEATKDYDNFDLFAAALTYLKQKKLNIINSILKKF